MLQEEQTVTFDPRYIDVYVPWYIRLFYLYLALVLLVTVVRAARLVWALRSQRIAKRAFESFLHARSLDLWDHLYFKIRTLRALSHVTLLISIAALLWSLADNMTQVATQKAASIGAVAGGLADTLRTFSVGVVVSIALFCFAFLCERVIRRRKLGVVRELSRDAHS